MIRSAAALAATLLGATSALAAPTYIHAGKLIAVPGQATRGASTIVVDDGRIVSVLDGHVPAPEGSPVIDLKARTVLPGLIDSHVHLATDRAGNERLTASVTDSLPLNAHETYWNGMKTLRAGFTTVRNLGDDGGKVLARKEAARRGWVMAPRIIDAGESISTTGGHMDGRVGLADHVHGTIGTENLCDGLEDCRRAVRRQIGRGADVIKFATTGGVNSGTGLATRMIEEEARALVDTAHAYGRKVAVHAHGAEGIKLAVRVGADSIEHGTVMDDEILKLMKEKRTFYVPTLSTVNGYLERLAANPDAYPPGDQGADRLAHRHHRQVAAKGLPGGHPHRLWHRCRRLQARPQRRRVRAAGQVRHAPRRGDQGRHGQCRRAAGCRQGNRHDRTGQGGRHHRGRRRSAGRCESAESHEVRHGARPGGGRALSPSTRHCERRSRAAIQGVIAERRWIGSPLRSSQ